jgi:anti-sigma B factor antagonist
MFAIERTRVNDGACFAVAGEVDVETAPRMRDALLETIAEEEAVILDLGSVTFMDSTGLSAMVAVGQAAKANGVALRLREVPPRVMKLLTLTGLDGVLTVEAVPSDGLGG